MWAKIAEPIAVLALAGGVVDPADRGDGTKVNTAAPLTTTGSTTTVPSLMFAECKDGSLSDNREFSKTCSSHKGIARWLAPSVLCKSGDVVELNKNASCEGKKGGVDRLLEDGDARSFAAISTTTSTSTTTRTATTTSRATTTTAQTIPTTTRPATTTAQTTTTRPATTTAIRTPTPATAPPRKQFGVRNGLLSKR